MRAKTFVDDFKVSTTSQFFEFDQGKVWFNARRVTIHESLMAKGFNPEALERIEATLDPMFLVPRQGGRLAPHAHRYTGEG